MTGLPISSAMALAPSAVSVTRPGVVGTLCLANSSFAWYSKRSMGSLLCVGLVFRLHASPEFFVARLRELYRERSELHRRHRWMWQISRAQGSDSTHIL